MIILDELLALLTQHWTLLRVELGAIARSLLGVLVAGALVALLVLVAPIILLLALALVGGETLFGSGLWGALDLALLLLFAASLLVTRALAVGGRPLLRGVLSGSLAGGAVALLLGEGVCDGGLRAGAAIAAGLIGALVGSVSTLRRFDAQAFTDRFRPLASEAELRETLAVAEDLLGGRRMRRDR